MQCHYNFNRFITSFTITSFSSGFDSAIINVIATNVPSLSLFSLSKNNALFLSKNSRNSDAAILSPLYQVHLQASLTEYQLFRNYYDSYWKPLLDAVGMSHRPHDTRHTCVSLLTVAGVSDKVIKKIIGHKGQGVTEIVYTHFEIEELIDAINKI